MKTISKIIFATILSVTSALASAANLPDGIKGLKAGMSGPQVLAQMNKIYGQDVSKAFQCSKADDFQKGAGMCIIKQPGVKYAGVDVESLAMAILPSGLGNVFVTLATPKTQKEHDTQVKQVTAALSQFLPMPANVLKDDLMWKLDDGSLFNVVNTHQRVSVMLESAEYSKIEIAHMHAEQERGQQQKAKASGL